jgi:hypothetical protein
VRSMNTKPAKASTHSKTYERAPLVAYFKDDVRALSLRLERDMNTEWNIV